MLSINNFEHFVFLQFFLQKRKQLAEHLSSFKLNVTGHAGYKLAEVTGGGVPLTEINTATMESKVQQGEES